MLIEFDKIEEQALENFKGGEGTFFLRASEQGVCRIMKGRLEPGSSLGMHTHEGNYEVIYILSGKGTILYDEEKLEVAAGSCQYCPEGHAHRLMNTGSETLTFFAIVPKV